MLRRDKDKLVGRRGEETGDLKTEVHSLHTRPNECGVIDLLRSAAVNFPCSPGDMAAACTHLDSDAASSVTPVILGYFQLSFEPYQKNNTVFSNYFGFL